MKEIYRLHVPGEYCGISMNDSMSHKVHQYSAESSTSDPLSGANQHIGLLR